MEEVPQTLSSQENRRIWIEIGLLIGFVGVPIWLSLLFNSSYRPSTLTEDALSRLSQYLPVCALVLYFMWQSRKGRAHYGLGKNLNFLGVFTFVGGLFTVGLFSVWISEVLRQAIDPSSIQPNASDWGPVPRTVQEWLTMWPVLLVGAAFEELVFRGFITTRIFDATKLKWLAILLPSIVFGSYHIYQGVYWMLGATIYGVLFSWMFLEWRRLKSLILAHFAFNAWAFSYYLA